MGNTCSPDKPGDDKNAPVTDMDKQAALEETAAQEGGQPSEKLTQIINTYQAENERLKKEVAEMKTQQTERVAQEQDSDDLLRELNTMRELVKQKDMAVVQSKVEAALFARANSMKDAETAAQVLKKDNLEKFGKAGKGSAKPKFVTVSLLKGTRTAAGFEPGMIRLSYSETETSGSLNAGRVTKVKTADNIAKNYKGRTFTVEAVIGGAAKDLVFACKDTAERDSWVQTFQTGFDKIKDEAESMREHFKLTLAFTKEKLGIRVEEKVIEQDEPLSLDEKKEDDGYAAPAPEAEDKADAATTTDDVPAPAADYEAEKQEGEAAEAPKEDYANEGEKPAAEPAKDADYTEPAQAAEAAEEEKTVEPPCTLVVTAISDTDLQEKGLCETMALLKLNDTDLDGLPYSQQLEMLTQTKKPFTITFSGAKYLKLGKDQLNVFPAILKKLTAAEPNDAQTAFMSLIKGTQFGKDLEASDDKEGLITELLSNQHKLSNLLQSVDNQYADL